MLGIDEVFIHKVDKNTGEASVKISDPNNEDFGDLQIKKIQLNFLDSANPISVYKAHGVSVISGTMFDVMCDIISEIWENISDQDPGIYRATEDQIIKEG